jgi:choline transport protein
MSNSYFAFGLGNGGSAGLVTSYILSWAGFLAIMTPLAELASMAPTSSGQYHWVYMLAPASYRKFLSYLTGAFSIASLDLRFTSTDRTNICSIGWLSIAVWQAMVAMGGTLGATLIQTLLTLNYPEEYTEKGWHGTLLIWATVIVAFVINSVLGRWLPKIEGLILYLHILGFFAIIIPLLHLSSKVDSHQVFTSWNNDGGWSTMGLAFFVGIVSNVGPFIGKKSACRPAEVVANMSLLTGADGVVHLAEETHNASIVIPWNIVITIIFNGLLGFAMLLIALFCTGDLEAAMESPLRYPFVHIFLTSTKSVSGTTVLICIILILSYAATFGQFAGASRQLWAFARDNGPPFSSWLVLVSPACCKHRMKNNG